MRIDEIITESKFVDFEGVNISFHRSNKRPQILVRALDDWGNKELGHVLFNIGDGNELDPQDLEVDERFRGQGIAKIMYDFVKSKGYQINRSWDQTDAGSGFWEKHRGEDVRIWEDKVTESLSRVAFHYTNNKTALSILNSGTFQLSSALGSVEQQYAPKGYPYFLSTTRTRRGGYHRTIGQQATLFVLDGSWFNNNYISKPVDYWENRNPSLPHHREHEAEDRVFSRDPSIPITGVTAVHLYCDANADPEVKAWTRQALIAAKRQSIPAYYYADKEAWRNFNIRKQGNVANLTGQERTGGHIGRHRGYLLPWMELIQAKDISQLSKKADSIRYSLQYDYNKDSAASGLNTDLSNARKPNSGADRANAVKIIKYMQQNRLNTIMDLVNFLANKWKSSSITEYVNAETVKTGFKDQQVIGDLLLTAEGEDRKVYNTDVNVLHIRVLTNTSDREELAWTDFLVKKRHEDGEKYLEAAYVFVSPRHRGKGLAKLMYQYANDTLGNDIQPSAMQTDMGKGMWTGLNKSIRKPVALKPEEPKVKPSLFSRIKRAFKETHN